MTYEEFLKKGSRQEYALLDWPLPDSVKELEPKVTQQLLKLEDVTVT